MMAFPVMIGCILVAKEFVPIFFGNGYDKVIVLIQIISPIILFIGMSNILGTQYLLPARKQKEYTISVVCGAIINFILNLILINKLNSIGASIATIVAEFLVAIVQLYYVRDLLKFTEIVSSTKNYFISAVVMGVITYLVNMIFSLSGVISVGVEVIVGVITYGLMLIILKDNFLEYIKERALNVLRNRG